MTEAEGLFFLSAIIPSSFSNENDELISLKASISTGMANRAGGRGLDQQCIIIAINR
jgi:hypothetical protein